MDFNGPGTSLFQGTDLNSFNCNAQRDEEEEEAIEEQKRRDIELKNILENAFNDVSFDNEDCSGINISFNHSDLNCQNINKSQASQTDEVKNLNFTNPDFGKNCSVEEAQEYLTPVRPSKSLRTKTIDFNNLYETDNHSDQFRIKQQNGSLHDIVDASGGGDAGLSMHYNHCVRSLNSLGEHNSVQNSASPKTSGAGSTNKLYQNADYNSVEQLQILYDVRVREVHSLTELVDRMKNENEIEKIELKRQLALAAAEIERYKITQNDLQNIVVASKEDCDNLKLENDSLKKAINELEEAKEGLLIDLETSRAAINNLERKVLALEKGRKDKTPEMQYEASIQELKEKHSLTLRNITNELDKYKADCEKTSKENDELKVKILQINQLMDENLARKSEVIQRLSKQVEETQEQCEKLMKNSVTEENIKLEMEIKILKEENSALSSKVELLEQKSANLEMELKQYECLGNLSAFETKDTSDRSLDKENEFSEINKKLREELLRALNSQKARRQEIQSLQALLMKKDEQIQCMTEKEKELSAEAAKYRDDIAKHISELKNLQQVLAVKEAENKKLEDLLELTKKELGKELRDAQTKCQDLEDSNKSLQEEIMALKSNSEQEKLDVVSKYNEEYLKFHNLGLSRVREEIEESFRLQLLEKDMEIENLKKEMEEAKNLYIDIYNEKENLLNQIEKTRANSSLGSVDVDDVKKLQKELEKSRQRILELDLTLRQQYQQEVEKLNNTIKSLNLELEKLRKEKDHDLSEANTVAKQILTENELLKREIEQITSEKNLYFLNCETLRKEIDQLRMDVEGLRERSDVQEHKFMEEHSRELQDIRNKYEITIQKLNKEIELMLAKSITTESKYTSPMKSNGKSLKHVAIQGSPVPVQSASTSPLHRLYTKESSTSPLYDSKHEIKTSSGKGSNKEVMLTDPEAKKMSKREVIRLMEKLGAEHEEEMNLMENKYKLELMKLETKWKMEINSIKEEVKEEMMRMHVEEMEELRGKHKIEMANRVEQEKKEAIVGLITEWAWEVQNLKQSQAEAVAQAERLKLKYKAAKNMAIHYKTYLVSKAERMREEWRKAETIYENSLKELEKKVHMLVDVREDEVKAKIQSITKAYEQKINKLKIRLEKYDDLLKPDLKADDVELVTSSKNSVDEVKSPASDREPDKLVAPDSRLCRKLKRNDVVSGELPQRNDAEKNIWKRDQFRKLFLSESDDAVNKLLQGKRGKDYI